MLTLTAMDPYHHDADRIREGRRRLRARPRRRLGVALTLALVAAAALALAGCGVEITPELETSVRTEIAGTARALDLWDTLTDEQKRESAEESNRFAANVADELEISVAPELRR